MKKGISLIVLVITIIVIVVISGSVILSLSNNNPINQASMASLKATVDTYSSELSIAVANMYAANSNFKSDLFNATVWNGNDANTTGTVKQYITSMSSKDAFKYEIQRGKLVYVGSDISEKNTVNEIFVGNSSTMIAKNFKVTSRGWNCYYLVPSQGSETKYYIDGSLNYAGTRGITLIAYDSVTFAEIKKVTYDVYANTALGDNLATDILALPDGCIMMITINDAINISNNLRNALTQVNLPNANTIARETGLTSQLPNQRMGLIFVSYKGGTIIDYQFDNTGVLLLTMEKTIYTRP